MYLPGDFHPAIEDWFGARYASPTGVQLASWPLIAEGQHVLATAPTGSGKTLTAFLWALNQFALGQWQTGRTSVLYISPLKALNNDVRRNLLQPLQELRSGYDFPSLKVSTRSGDTPQAERQRLLRRPPDILITTPESLALMLTTTRGRQALSHVQTVVVDEVHAIVGNRRGIQLMTSLERLVRLAGEFQRIALSATVRPLQAVADYVAGYQGNGQARQMAVVDSDSAKQIDFRVRFPVAVREAASQGQSIWEPLSDTFRAVIDGNRSTLLFTNSRRLAEKITLMINRDQLAPLAYAHHGSLSRELRTEVEQRMKAGELRAIVATSSLELGIDVGHLDEVVMVQSPPSVASALQRIGRAGHQVGEVSVGTLYPCHAQDLLEAAVLAGGIARRDIEPIKPMENALDVLAQLVISITATDPWAVEELFELVRCAAPYHRLSREHFDLVIDMLAGRYAGSRVRELKPRVIFDREQGTVQAHRSAVFALYTSGGTIPDRGYYQLRHVDTGAVLGELDEEFVWEATIGQVFTLGTQGWQIQRITHNDVMVRAARPGATAPPFWRSESFNRGFAYACALTDFLALANSLLAGQGGESLMVELQQRGFDATAAAELVDYLQRQRDATSGDLPHRHEILLERIEAGPGGYRGPDNPRQLVLHTFWGGQLNRPWALALEAAWRRGSECVPDIHADNNVIVIQGREEPDPGAILAMVRPENLESLLREALESSGFFGARFRECAGRALLLNRHRFNQRLPLWMSRMQARKLMTSVRGFSDFPILLETWRTCLEDEFDIDALSATLAELESGVIGWRYVTTAIPSPFARNVTFSQVSRYMYADDTPEQQGPSALRSDLISSAVHIDALRPRVDRAVVGEFLARRQRTASGYEPQGEVEWGEWLKERVLLPEVEWQDDLRHWLAVSRQLVIIAVGSRRWATHRELEYGLYHSGLVPGSVPAAAPRIDDLRDARQLALEILSCYGPLRDVDIAGLLPGIPEALFSDDTPLIHGQLLVEDEQWYWCDADNFESVLRFQRARRRSQLEAQPCSALPAFWSIWQGLGESADAAASSAVATEQRYNRLEQLRGYSAPVTLWLQELLAPRTPISDHQLDQAIAELGLLWLGTGSERITVCYPEELGLLRGTVASGPAEESTIAALFQDPSASYGFFQLAERSALPLAEFSEHWWDTVWSGELTADSLVPLRQGLARGFSAANPVGETTRSRRRRVRGLALGWPGNWQLVPPVSSSDALAALDDSKERVRILLDRYGVLCREVVNREWVWRDAFRALRLMELAGEVVTGYFFTGLSGPQFATARAVSVLSAHRQPPSVSWCSALDPASPCGLGLDWPELPQRRAGNYLAFYRGQLALVVEGFGRRLHYHGVDADLQELDRVNAPLVHLAGLRRAQSRKPMMIESINGEAVQHSPYRPALERVLLLTHDHRHTFLEPF